MLCSIKLPFIFLGTPMPSLRAINDNNGFYSSLHSNYLPSLWLPLPLLLPTSGKDRPPPTDACRARWGGRTIGHDGAVRQRLKLTSLGPVESFRRQEKKLLDWQDLKLLLHLSLERFFLWISFYLHHDHGVISVINVINILYVVQKKMHYLKLVQGGQDVNLLRRKYRCSHLNGSSIIVLVTDFWKKKISRKYILSHLNRSSIIVQLTDWV